MGSTTGGAVHVASLNDSSHASKNRRRFTRLDRFWDCSPTRGAGGSHVSEEELAAWMPEGDDVAVVVVDGIIDAARSRGLGAHALGWCGSVADVRDRRLVFRDALVLCVGGSRSSPAEEIAHCTL